jgi:hypothetical protein
LKPSQIEGNININDCIKAKSPMSRLPKAIREKILRCEGALTEAEAAAFVGVKTLAEFRRLRRTGLLGDPIPGTTLWNQVELHRSISQCRPAPSICSA